MRHWDWTYCSIAVYILLLAHLKKLVKNNLSSPASCIIPLSELFLAAVQCGGRSLDREPEMTGLSPASRIRCLPSRVPLPRHDS